ncbi:hypothetical protein RsS62_16940 [Rhizobium dioscoreae]|nr:hypothetical protein RsS62_16940 [Rhizobium dioscoreae]
MQSFLAAHLIFEMLHGVGDITTVPIHARFLKAFIKKPAGRSDKRPAGHILLVARLFTDQHDVGLGRPFAEHEMSGVAIEIAACAGSSILMQLIKCLCIGMLIAERWACAGRRKSLEHWGLAVVPDSMTIN